ncbi:hypothetical protein QMK33_19685 [Hymenobacter sp. H14-R3]|uniref:hypothetical protein n=1 Tax=Hymenobacter sp. H14-R3 TaxID=3046308 RepID=UPI0024B9544B|nr:hypothetical protein [Hymenobacter sp. H14-R3]MDJ0367376.1 hypothetical protein [Hymenobacter sp. H14-R3]
MPAAPPITYDPAPWYVHWLETMPVSVVIVLGILAFFAWLLKKPVEEFASKLFDQLTDRLKRSSKEPASGADLVRKAKKAIILEQAAEALRVRVDCDHVSVYGCQNGEYLRSGEGIDKFVMQAEAVEQGLPRYMDTERMVFAQDIPRTITALELQPYLLLWAERCDDWKVNKMMQERGYDSSIAVFVRRPIKPGSPEMGIIGMYVLSWRDCEVYRPDQASTLPKSHQGPTRLLDSDMEHLLQEYANKFSYSM